MKHSLMLILGGLLATAPPAAAQELSTEEMKELLKPRVSTTRSMSAPHALDTEEADLIDSLTGLTRSITVVERQALAPVVANAALPQLDLTIEFEFDSATITPEATRVLVQLGTALSDDDLAQYVFVLAGHTDAKGTAEYNQDLSERRADAVKGFLVRAFGIDSRFLIAVGFGEEQLKSNYDPEAAENRRVTVVNVGR